MRAAAERRAAPAGILIEDAVAGVYVCGRAGELNIVAKLMPPIRVINARRSRTFFAGISCRAKHSTGRHVACVIAVELVQRVCVILPAQRVCH